MTYLDTHVVVWLHHSGGSLLSITAAQQLESDELLISPAVVFELLLLHEIRRLRPTAATVVADLEREIGLRICELPFRQVIDGAAAQSWTRDPFDRLIVGHAAARDAALITKDRAIRRHYPRAVW